MTAYQGFAALYDHLMEDVDYEGWYRGYLDLLHLSPPARAVDLACGTGEFTLRLARDGFAVTGVDLSSDMLRRAQDKSRAWGVRPPLVRQDITRLNLPRPVDFALCACDGFNYLTSLAALEQGFRAAAQALVPGGLLAFDVSTPHKLLHMAGQLYGEDGEETAYLWNNTLLGDKLLRMDLTFFVREADGRYRRFCEEHTQRAHTLCELKAALSAAGLTLLAVRGRDFSPAKDDEARLHLLARKGDAIG